MTSRETPAQSSPAQLEWWCASCERHYLAAFGGSTCQQCWERETEWQHITKPPVGQTRRLASLPGTKNYKPVTVTPLRYDLPVGEHMFVTGAPETGARAAAPACPCLAYVPASVVDR